ncbi:hypothetical protein [Streptomyces sp. NBC_00996]|uniref:hypothetical protein n=1 Tax=Streptomyces sp. NBC_00996 TaxID=2903710 RepID=UPI00386FF543|nr:hypothetical protein OG390_24695 [Streptomyces sp. NBC_00996]
MGVERHIRALLREDERGAETFTFQSPWNSKRKFAAYAYIAEQYGYVYAGLEPTLSGSARPVFLFRRNPSPEARERAAATRAQYPSAPRGGPTPGMKPVASGLRPLPKVRPAVDLLHARIEVDLSGDVQRKRTLPFLFIAPILIVIALAKIGFTATSVAVGAFVWLAVFGLYFLGLWMARRRYAKYAQILDAAGRGVTGDDSPRH